MQALKKQLLFELKKINSKKINSIFFGGGTPSSVEVEYYEPLFQILEPYIDLETEITFEANPNSASFLWMDGIKKLGANRISFGVQSFNTKKLKFLGRAHKKEQAILALENAQKVGFVNINMDIIYDTMLDTKDLLKNDLDIVKSLNINHISAYSLTIEEGTKFFTKPHVQVENLDNAKFLFEQLVKLGFEQYEISNFAKSKQARSKHNYGYWQKSDYLGVGAGAVGTLDNIRTYPKKDLKQYIEEPCEYEKMEIINEDDNKFDNIFLALRSDVGVELDWFNTSQRENINFLLKEKKLFKYGNKIFNKNYLLTDEIVLFIN